MKSESFIYKFLFLFIPLLLSACGKATASTPTLTPQVVIPSSVTNTPSPARTRAPTKNLALTETINGGQRAFETKRAATENALANTIAPFPRNCGNIYGFLISPDDNWLASEYFDGRNIMIVTNRDNTKYWRIPKIEFDYEYPVHDIPFCEGIPFHWSNDSRYLYFFLYYCIEADIEKDYRLDDMNSGTTSLYQLDILTGLWFQLTSPSNYYSFSPTGRRLVYFIRHDLENGSKASIEIKILDLKTGEILNYQLINYLAAANIVWSEDGTRFVFSAVKGTPWGFYTKPYKTEYTHDATYTVFMFDLNKQFLAKIKDFPNSETQIYPTEWMKNIITIYSEYSYSDSDRGFHVIYFDTSTNQLITPTPTP